MAVMHGSTQRLPWSDGDWPAVTIHDAARRARERWGADKVVFTYPDAGVDITLGTLAADADEWTAALIAAGVESGDRVAVALAGDPRWPVLQVACSQAGAVLVGVNTRYGSHELADVLGRAAPRVIVTTGNRDGRDFADRLAGVLQHLPGDPTVVLTDGSGPAGWLPVPDFLLRGTSRVGEVPARRSRVRPGDHALIQFTSGSTAAPKGVLLSHDAVLRSAFHVMTSAGYTAEDVVYSALPFYHIGGTITTGPAALVCGARMVVPEFYDAARSVQQMIEHGCTAEQGHAAMFTMQIDAAGRLGVIDQLRLRKGWVAAPPSVMRRIADELGIVDVVPVYGMSEYGLISAGGLDEPLEERLRGIGWPVPGAEVRLDPREGGDGVGEILVRGSQLMSGYFGDPDATVAALSDDGWLRTGDLARYDEDGRLVFAGREKEMIKPGGENVSAAEIEEFLRSHPRIAAVAVIAVRDARLGEAPAAVVQTADGAPLDLGEIVAFCSGRIARFKIPKAVFGEPELPLLANGKIDKLTLSERYGDTEVSA